MNELTLLREAGPEAPALSTAARLAARAALLDEIGGSTARRVRRPRHRTVIRIGAGLAAVAAAWTTAVVVGAPDGPGTPATSVDLVAFRPVTFPLTPDPLPAGTSVTFDGDRGALRASYRAGHDGFTVSVTDTEPDLTDVSGTEDVTVAGRDAELVTTTSNDCTTTCHLVDETALVWERADDQWVALRGSGTYDDGDRLVRLAGTLADRPQPIPLQVHLAPAGWSVQGFKDGRILTLVNDSYEWQELSVHLPEAAVPADELRSQVPAVGPLVPVTVHGRPAQLVRVDQGLADGSQGWYLQAQFPDGRTFVVQAPGIFTQQQVLQVAEQVSYTP